MVKLVGRTENVACEFEIEHAERILRLRGTSWQLPVDSDYKFENGIISPRGKKETD